jgi:hypothetical protein
MTGDAEEMIELTWPRTSNLQIPKYRTENDMEYKIDFNLCNFSNEPVQNLSNTNDTNDITTFSFIENYIQDKLNVRFGGVTVHLEGDRFTQVCPLKIGSYTINVSPLTDGGACASFSVSKSSQFHAAAINRTTQMTGDADEMIELSWPVNSELQIRKNKIQNDMDYKIDFNLCNFSDVPVPLQLTDSATKSYVDEQILLQKNQMLQIELINDTFYNVANLPIGSYFISISCTFIGGSCCTFLVSKMIILPIL